MLLLSLALAAGAAYAQQCTYEVEPNETPATATRLTGAGPQMLGPARGNSVGGLCLTGDVSASDQDAFRWDVSEEQAAHRWEIELVGPGGTLTKLDLFRVTFAENGSDVTAVDKLLDIGTQGGAAAVSEQFLVEPGAYFLGLSNSGNGGEYVANVRPVSVLRYGDADERYDELSRSRSYTGEFGLYGPVDGELEQKFSLGEAEAGRVWGLELWAALGTAPSLRLEGPGGVIAEGKAGADGRVRLPGLGLGVGDYVARVVGASGMIRLRLESQGIRGDGVAVEPNDDWQTATVFPVAGEMRATLHGRDYFRIDVPEDGAGIYDFDFDPDSELSYTFMDAAGTKLMMSGRGSVGGTRHGLSLVEGTYRLLVEGTDGVQYRMALRPAAAIGDELEPNDTPAGASPIPENGKVRGQFDRYEADVYRLEVTGEAQLYRVQLVGPTATRLTQQTARGQELARASGTNRLRLDDLVLLPGTHYFEVLGEGGEYALRVLALGPAPVATQGAAAGPAPDEPLSPAAPGTPTEPAEEAAAAPEAAPLVAGPPPPPGILELEPNDDASRAMRLIPDQVHVGRLTGGSDDYYRFFLARDQYVRLELQPPEGGLPIGIRLDDVGWLSVLDGDEGGPAVYERKFLAGNHGLFLRSPEVESDGYYQLRLTFPNNLLPPVDAEPNDDIRTASTLPAELEWTGQAGEFGGDPDFYRLPVFDKDTVFRLTLEGTSKRPDVMFTREGGRLQLSESKADEGGGVWSGTIPAGESTWLRLYVNSRYEARLSFDGVPDPAQLLAPRASGALNVTLESSADELAAFWHEGQAFVATATVENRTDSPQEVRLEAASNNPLVGLSYEAGLTLAAGESRAVPVEVLVPRDLRDDLPLRVEVSAVSSEGSAAADVVATARCEAQPVDPRAAWPLPDSLLGRFDALRPNFGAALFGASDYERRDRQLIDGRVGPSGGGYLHLSHSPTYRLAGDGPVTLLGATLDPRSDARAGDYLKAFRIETSLDGRQFTPAFDGVLEASAVEQAFVFDAPVTASYARLVFVSSQRNSSNAYLGEWKLIAAPDATFGEVNLAAPEAGGHVVTSDPYIGSHGASLITGDDGSASAVDLRSKEAFTFVVGFHDGRAAQVTRIEWQDKLDTGSRNGAPFPGATVEVSLTGGAGPWAPLADWTLQRDAGGLATLQLAEPAWARYLKFTAAKVDGDDGEPGRYFSPPDVLRVFERAPDDEYRSALGEWGAMSRDAIYEYLNPVTVGRELPDAGNDTLQSATPLRSGEQVSGAVEVAVDEDWYRLTIPAGQNFLELTLAGDPQIFYLYELVDASGNQVGFDERFEGDDVVLSLFADPGDYYLHLWEPKRTVVFSWDTSGSVSPYQAITYNSLASFAAGVNGEREAVQLLAFDDPAPKWLLPFWSSDPQRVQRSIVEFDREADSSNSETALLTATKALEDREGTRAILLMTDAESPSQAITSDLWAAFERVRPRIFTFEISSGGSDYAQDLMQDWADVNSGIYSLAAGIGDFDAGFSRASCVLRRPKRYVLMLNTRAAPLPGPGSLSVQAAPGAARAAVEIVFDASGSMGKELPSGEQRITAAKRALTQLVNEVLPEETPFALRAFGHIKPSSCETRLDLPLAPLDRAKAAAVVQAIEPKLLSQTPIADSLLAVKDDLAQAGGARTVILITDGEESCGGDPAAAVRELRASGPVDFAIVSLGLEPEALAVFQALAADVGATYVDVSSFEALSEAVAEALNPAFEVFDAKSGELVARGRVGADPVSLEMGVYDVRVLVSPVQEFRAVRVPGERDVRLTLREP